MNDEEALALLRQRLQTFRERSYADLVTLLGKPQVAEVVGLSGARYQLEVEVHWDSRPGGTVRVLGAIDNRDVRALMPLAEDFLMAPNGAFLGE